MDDRKAAHQAVLDAANRNEIANRQTADWLQRHSAERVAQEHRHDMERQELEQELSLMRQTQALHTLQGLPVSDAIGAACSFLLHCAYTHPEIFRRVLNEKVVREGFRGVSLLEVFKRAG